MSVVRAATWQEMGCQSFVEGQIARTLTNDTYRADDRAMGSVNREISFQQQLLAEKIRALKAQLVLPIEDRMREADEIGAAAIAQLSSPAATAVSAVRAATTMTAALSPVPLAIDRPIRRLRRTTR